MLRATDQVAGLALEGGGVGLAVAVEVGGEGGGGGAGGAVAEADGAVAAAEDGPEGVALAEGGEIVAAVAVEVADDGDRPPVAELERAEAGGRLLDGPDGRRGAEVAEVGLAVAVEIALDGHVARVRPAGRGGRADAGQDQGAEAAVGAAEGGEVGAAVAVEVAAHAVDDPDREGGALAADLPGRDVDRAGGDVEHADRLGRHGDDGEAVGVGGDGGHDRHAGDDELNGRVGRSGRDDDPRLADGGDVVAGDAGVVGRQQGDDGDRQHGRGRAVLDLEPEGPRLGGAAGGVAGAGGDLVDADGQVGGELDLIRPVRLHENRADARGQRDEAAGRAGDLAVEVDQADGQRRSAGADQEGTDDGGDAVAGGAGVVGRAEGDGGRRNRGGVAGADDERQGVGDDEVADAVGGAGGELIRAEGEVGLGRPI